MLRVVHIAPVSFERPSGPTIVLDNILPYLKSLGVDISLISSASGGPPKVWWHTSAHLEDSIISFNRLSDLFSSKLEKILSTADIAHIHGVLNFKHALIAMLLRSKGIPYIVTPHGQLQTDALKYHGAKKKIAIRTALRPLLMNANALQVFSESECRRLAPYFSKDAKIYKIPNGISQQPSISNDIKLRDMVAKAREASNKVFCYAGRLDIACKGLDLFAEAIIPIKDQLIAFGAKIWLIGNYLTKHDKVLLEKKLFQINDQIVYWGVRSLDEKNLITSYADVFFHTSRNEGMPLAVLEAMQMGLPVLITEGTNMKEIVEVSTGGWCVQTNVQAIRDAFLKIVALDIATLKKIGMRAKGYVYAHLSWKRISEQLLDMYKELSGLGHKF